jgi:hypothetical protein
LTYIGKYTGIAPNHVCGICKKLIGAKIIKKSYKEGTRSQVLGLNTKVSEWLDTPIFGSTKSGSVDTPIYGSVNTPIFGSDYNTDIYNTECVGAAQAPPRHTPIFDRLWSEWKYSQAGKERVTKKQREEIENNGYLRMADAAERYYRDFDSRTSLHNQPLSARTWFSGAYIQYLPTVDEATRIWYDVDGHKCRGERRYV